MYVGGGGGVLTRASERASERTGGRFFFFFFFIFGGPARHHVALIMATLFAVLIVYIARVVKSELSGQISRILTGIREITRRRNDQTGQGNDIIAFYT